MLNFRNTNIVFISLVLLLITVQLLYVLPIYIYLIVFVVYSLIVFYGCCQVDSNFFIPVICSANTTEKEIAISFDDGPATNYTVEILQVLKVENIRAAFFCIGNRLKGNEQLIRRMMDDGHIIGNHSYTHHFWFDMFSSKRMLEDMMKMDLELEKIIGKKPKLFRPPYGVTNPNLKKAIRQGGYTPIGWNVRSLDTVIKEEEKLLGKLIKSITPGSVFLFHDTCKITLDILPAFIQEVKNRGYAIVPLDKLLHLKPYA